MRRSILLFVILIIFLCIASIVDNADKKDMEINLISDTDSTINKNPTDSTTINFPSQKVLK